MQARSRRPRPRNIRIEAALLPIALCLAIATAGAAAVTRVEPKLRLPSLPGDADDCAIWVHPTDPAKSTVVGNDKSGRRKGLTVYDLEAHALQFVPMARPSNLDVRYTVSLGGRSTDVCAAIERNANRIAIFAIDPQTRRLTDISAPEGVSTFIEGDTYGFALYKRPADGALFAFASSSGAGDLTQVRLADDGQGRVKGSLVRRFARGLVRTRVEGMVADDELGFLYAADEGRAVLKFHADPRKGSGLIRTFATGDGIRGDREGIAIYDCGDGDGYLLLSSQGNSTVKVYTRKGDNTFLKTVDTVGATDTDGLDVTACPAGPAFPKGFLVCHNSPGRQFVLYAWEDVAAEDLRVSTKRDPRRASSAAPRP
ncbi:phytase [bacterium]|nr:phytase [bacterium]